MTFPGEPVNQEQYTLGNLVYTYYQIDNTWYVQGSDPGNVDPQIYSRSRDWTRNYDIVTTFEGHQYYSKFINLKQEVERRVKSIDELIAQYNTFDSGKQMIYSGQLSYLQTLKANTLALLNNDPAEIVWPPAPPINFYGI